MSARQRLELAIVAAAAERRRIPCGTYGTAAAWLSEDEAERAQAADACRYCPVILPCATAAIEGRERWGTWAGYDASTKTGRASLAALAQQALPNRKD